jgi:crossover junction endodeoxyribonuclease RuvC
LYAYKKVTWYFDTDIFLLKNSGVAAPVEPRKVKIPSYFFSAIHYNYLMKILGIDPGYDRCGIAIIEKPIKGKETLLFSSCIVTSPKDSIYERLKKIGEIIAETIDTHKPDALAIETLFITKNQKTAMRVSEARGIIIYQALERNIPVFEYAPMQIKMAITSDGSSDKSRIMKMIPLLVDLSKISKKALDDEYDAIAVALTHSAIIRPISIIK